jgi:hypothetical protein
MLLRLPCLLLLSWLLLLLLCRTHLVLLISLEIGNDH